MSNTTFKPTLGLLDATMIVAGSMIGSGIFIVSADITRNVGSAGWLMIVWIITGFMTLTAALSYGELSAMYPKAGGQYVYLKEAYNPLIGFLYGWSFFAVIQTATIAAVGVAFAKFTAYILPFFSEDIIAVNLGFLTISRAQVLSIVVITLLTFINSQGVKTGKIIQTTFTLTKLLSLFGLIIVGLLVAKGTVWHNNWQNAWQLHEMKPDGSFSDYLPMAAAGAVAAAMVGSVFSSDSWNNVTFIAGEIKNPQRNIGLSLFLGTFIVTLIYLCTNLVYTAVLPLHEIATAPKDRVGVVASEVIFGNIGTVVIALMIMVSTFGCNNGLILAGARVYYTMAKDGLFFAKAGTLNQNAVPAYALWLQCIFACAWCLSGKYGDLLDMISFVVVCFYMLTIGGIFILRKKKPDMERPYKAFGYPVLPIIYIIMGLSFCLLLIIYKPKFTWPGLLITLLGVPVYYLIKASFGWLNYALIAAPEKKKQFNPVGGEERFWMGPEGGQFSIYFKGGDSFNINHWQVPSFIDTISYDVKQSDKSTATFTKQTSVTNFSGTRFDMAIERKINLLSKAQAAAVLNIAVPEALHFVGYTTANNVTNTGSNDWTKENGLLSIWLLGMFTPSPETMVIIPFHPIPNARSFITDNYFGEIPKERLQVKDSVLYFTCDGKLRSKIGLSPLIAKPIAASFDFKNNVLTVVLPEVHKDAAYVNSKWELQKEPYKGDVINSYNDGPLADGTQIGPFYEVESSSPALALKQGETGSYKETTCHFQGDYNALKLLAQQLLGVDLDRIKN